MNQVFNNLYELISERKHTAESNSYTSYLFEKGLDKILKKCGEECSEVIIAAKNLTDDNREELKNEVADLLYHIVVLCVQCGVKWSEIEDILDERGKKSGNLKKIRNTEDDKL
jgi:phosphoribosyl-ATP pyrophosphohydrolase